MPDDYLLKPFTADTLKSRIDRLLEKKTRLLEVDKLQDQGRWQEIIPVCDEIIAARDKYLVDAMRIKGNALIMTKRFDQAIAFYQQALQMRSMPWAKLGLAKAYQGNGEHAQAKEALTDLLVETPRFLAAYDVLGRLHRGHRPGRGGSVGARPGIGDVPPTLWLAIVQLPGSPRKRGISVASKKP
ncbi:MAG: tetratricopeptide repeat protein [Candidatus Accumulibacter propinquus]